MPWVRMFLWGIWSTLKLALPPTDPQCYGSGCACGEWSSQEHEEIPQQALRGVWYGHCSLEDIRPPSGEEVDYNKKVSAANTVVAMLIELIPHVQM